MKLETIYCKRQRWIERLCLILEICSVQVEEK